MNLGKFARRRYTAGATPLEKLEHLTRHFDGPEIYFKRDDLLGLTLGGNKTRKLEFLVADALARGADTLITVGAVQSNHCRLTLAAAIKEGMRCRLVLEERVPGSYDPSASGNNFLFQLLGAESIAVVAAGANLTAAMEQIASELEREGRRGYIIPGGGSNPLGALGYVACAEEIVAQAFEQGLVIDHMICASGSAGTHAGLLVGLCGANRGIPVTGINVRRARDEQEANVLHLANETAALLGVAPPERSAVVALDEWVGEGYSLPTDEMVEAVELVAKLEGILLDPVYTGKAAAGLFGLIRREHFAKDQKILFVHTGGSPALYAYEPLFVAVA